MAVSSIPSDRYKETVKHRPFISTSQDDQDRSIAVLIGHSFIRRLRQHFGFMQDVEDDIDARIFARSLRVQCRFSEVYTKSVNLIDTKSVNLNVIDQLPHPADIPHIQGAALVVLDFGSNDFANIPNFDPQFVATYAQRIRQWCVSTQTRVVVQAILPRYGGISSSVQDFLRNSEAYNHNLRGNLPLTPLIRFNKMQGLMEPQFRAHVNPEDDIHVLRPDGKYYDNVRKSLLDFFLKSGRR